MNKQKGVSILATILIIVGVVIIVGAVGYFAFLKKSPSPTPTPAIQQNLKGWLLIYDLSVTVSELHNLGFKPLTWYLVSKDTTWPGSPTLDIELTFNSDSICYKPKDQFSDATESNCKEPKQWGYGDRVRVWGSKSGNTVTVSRMEIVSSLPVEQW